MATLRSWDLHSLPFNWNNFRPCILSQSPIQNWSLAWSPQLAIFGPKLTPGFQNGLVCLGITFTTLHREWFYSEAKSSSPETWCPVVVDANQNAVLISFCKKSSSYLVLQPNQAIFGRLTSSGNFCRKVDNWPQETVKE